MNTCGALCCSSRTLFNLISSISCYLVLKSFFQLQDRPLGHKVIATLSFADLIFHILQILLVWFDPSYPQSSNVIGLLTNITIQFSIFWSACMAYIIYQSFHRYEKHQLHDQAALDKYSQKRYLRLSIPCLLLVAILGIMSHYDLLNQALFSFLTYLSNAIALGAIVFYYLRAIFLIGKLPEMVKQSLKKTTKVLFAYLTVQMAVIAPIILRNFFMSSYPVWSLKIDYVLGILVALTGSANSLIFFWQRKTERSKNSWTPESSTYVSLNDLDEPL